MKTTYSKTFEARLERGEIITPARYVALTRDERSKIKSAQILPPKLGSKSFGKLFVEYKSPIYKVSA